MPGYTAPSTLTTLSLRPLAMAISLALGAGMAHGAASAPADGTGDEAPVMQTITVTASSDANAYTARNSASASKFNLSLRETPQAVSVVTRAHMDDFRLDNASKVLAHTTGVTVEAVETDRSYYTARGYDITNFQFDGVGIAFVFGLVMGDLDTALFERVDIVRGANGLISSTGNPSATVNFMRKRPTPDLAASAGVMLGSWNTRRLDADVSTPLSDDGKVAARFVVVHEEGNSHLDRYSPRKDVAYAIVEAKLTAIPAWPWATATTIAWPGAACGVPCPSPTRTARRPTIRFPPRLQPTGRAGASSITAASPNWRTSSAPTGA